MTTPTKPPNSSCKMLFSCLMLVETSCTSLRKSTCILSAVIIPSRSRAEVGLMLANSCPVLSHSIGTATLFIKDSTFICIRTFISETNTQINPAVPLGKLRCEGLGHFFSLLLAYKGGIHESKLLCVHSAPLHEEGPLTVPGASLQHTCGWFALIPAFMLLL